MPSFEGLTRADLRAAVRDGKRLLREAKTAREKSWAAYFLRSSRRELKERFGSRKRK